MMGISPSVVIEGQAYWADLVPSELLQRLSPADRSRVQRIAAAIERVRALGEQPRQPRRLQRRPMATFPGTGGPSTR